ncbi:hypothetical protein HYH03_015047 [Edaphochlamys debaryana]|uniref:Uncharacterized protein n=1 Tax=Edaphochlamys debaryana TaxID=47281 RepID=A0A836BT10_9CHLO|nr:hypothetical protein HYH03_015047 [Edaphochlamys debaryana]|eukprot:KAG2486343.1 hypothetical protein HYH03_015047 [Edaphochlamys debaryana]
MAARLSGGGATGLKQRDDSVEPGYAGYFGRKLQQTCSYSCSKFDTCLTNACTYFNSTHIYVVVSIGSCKPGSISWFCCSQQAPVCSLDTSSCTGTVSGNTCNTVTTVGYYIQIGTTSFSAQVHSSAASAPQPSAASAPQPSAPAAAQPSSASPAQSAAPAASASA